MFTLKKKKQREFPEEEQTMHENPAAPAGRADNETEEDRNPGFIEGNAASGEEEEAAMLAAFEDWLEESIPDTGRQDSARTAMNTVKEALKAGRYDAAMFEVIAKGADYDRAIAEARTLGEIDGRNARIEDLFDPLSEGDGLPHLGPADVTHPDRTPSIFDMARDA